MPRPPHILFLMDDQHRFDLFGFAGHPLAHTPHLDRLAAEGVVCTNAYTPSPVCVPARQCLASGKLPRHCGVERYGQDLPPNSETFARALAVAGYTTACAGKLHHMGTDQMQGWTRRVCNGDDLQISPEYLPGRDDAHAYAGSYPTAAIWPLAKELHRAGPGRSPYAVSDELNVAGACALLEEYFLSPHYQRATPERPLLLKVSLQQPHYPFCAPPESLARYLDRVTEYENQHTLDHPAFANWTRTPAGVSADDRRRALAATLAMVELCDAHFGRVLDQLRACGQDLDDWLVLYTSDHGEMLGEHDKWWKLSFYEGSVKVPLVLRAPRLFPGGRQLDANVSLCDLFATFCEVASAPVPPDLDSRSLLPLLRDDPGTRAAWPDEAVSQYNGTACMIKQGSLKYQWYGPAQPEVLFDLAADPGETVNALANPAHAAALTAFRARRAALGFG